jgi:hypothetical protein
MNKFLRCISLVLVLFHAIYLDGIVRIYDEKYHNIAQKMQSDIGVLVIAYNRPHYFEEVLNSLAQTPESKTLPFFFVLDGGPNATQTENIALIEKSGIKQKEIIARPYNYDCGKNVIDAKRFMFDWCGFDKVIIFEDDMVISPQYITLLLNLYHWAQAEYDNVGVVQCINHCYMDRETKKAHLDLVEEGRYDQWWAYCMDKKAHDATKDLLYTYEEKFLINWPQDILNGPALAEWMDYHLHAYESKKHERMYPAVKDYKSYFEKRIETLKVRQTMRRGQDIESQFALFKAGYVKITTVVNRSRNIGKTGFWFTPEWWEQNHFEEIVLDCFEDDMYRTIFVPHIHTLKSYSLFEGESCRLIDDEGQKV